MGDPLSEMGAFGLQHGKANSGGSRCTNTNLTPFINGKVLYNTFTWSGVRAFVDLFWGQMNHFVLKCHNSVLGIGKPPLKLAEVAIQ